MNHVGVTKMKWMTLIAAMLVLGTAAAFAETQTRYYDARGNSLGTATHNSQGTTFRDNRGNVTGRSSR